MGGVVGGVAAVAFIAVALYLCVKRGRAQRPPSLADRVEPFPLHELSARHPRERSPRRFSGASFLPPLHLGRKKLMPGPGSSTTATGESDVQA